MNPDNGGQSSSDLQKQAAAAIARRKVLAAYGDSAKTHEKEPKENSARMKDEPVTDKIDKSSSKTYHSAW